MMAPHGVVHHGTWPQDGARSYQAHHGNPYEHHWLVVSTPLKKHESVGIIIPNIWENKSHGLNHQPDQ